VLVITCILRFQQQACHRMMWARQIVANTERAKSVALYVRECCFIGWDVSKTQEFPFPSSTLYLQAMRCMTNIRKVMFFASFVSKEYWETMATLKQLECLTFTYCSFTENPPDQELSVHTVKLHSLIPPSFFDRLQLLRCALSRRTHWSLS
jgi:hypothetical protein